MLASSTRKRRGRNQSTRIRSARLDSPDLGKGVLMPDAAESARAARKRARAHSPAPEPAAEFAGLDLDELRALRTELTDYETRVSYWRRLVQARIDLLLAGGQLENHHRLAEVLADAPNRSRHIANLAILPPDETPPLPELDQLWQQVPSTPEQEAAHLADLRRVEHELSEHRKVLFTRIDALHQELIARYRQEPTLALALLPQL